MEPEEIPGELPETTLIDQVEGVPRADSEESPATPAVHAMALDAEDRARVEVRESTGSVVLDPVPPHCTVAGVPAEVVGRPRVDQPALEMDARLTNLGDGI